MIFNVSRLTFSLTSPWKTPGALRALIIPVIASGLGSLVMIGFGLTNVVQSKHTLEAAQIELIRLRGNRTPDDVRRDTDALSARLKTYDDTLQAYADRERQSLATLSSLATVINLAPKSLAITRYTVHDQSVEISVTARDRATLVALYDALQRRKFTVYGPTTSEDASDHTVTMTFTAAIPERH